MQTLEDKIKMLSPDERVTIEKLVDDLVEDHKLDNQNFKMSFGWEGALSDLKNQYTSVQLQHKILNLWNR